MWSTDITHNSTIIQRKLTMVGNTVGILLGWTSIRKRNWWVQGRDERTSNLVHCLTCRCCRWNTWKKSIVRSKDVRELEACIIIKADFYCLPVGCTATSNAKGRAMKCYENKKSTQKWFFDSNLLGLNDGIFVGIVVGSSTSPPVPLLYEQLH